MICGKRGLLASSCRQRGTTKGKTRCRLGPNVGLLPDSFLSCYGFEPSGCLKRRNSVSTVVVVLFVRSCILGKDRGIDTALTEKKGQLVETELLKASYLTSWPEATCKRFHCEKQRRTPAWKYHMQVGHVNLTWPDCPRPYDAEHADCTAPPSKRLAPFKQRCHRPMG